MRWRALMPHLAGEGLHAERLATFATRMRRANAAIDTLEGVRRTIGNRDAAVLADLARAYAGSGDGAIVWESLRPSSVSPARHRST